jgi:hypothetical protein
MSSWSFCISHFESISYFISHTNLKLTVLYRCHKSLRLPKYFSEYLNKYSLSQEHLKLKIQNQATYVGIPNFTWKRKWQTLQVARYTLDQFQWTRPSLNLPQTWYKWVNLQTFIQLQHQCSWRLRSNGIWLCQCCLMPSTSWVKKSKKNGILGVHVSWQRRH